MGVRANKCLNIEIIVLFFIVPNPIFCNLKRETISLTFNLNIKTILKTNY